MKKSCNYKNHYREGKVMETNKNEDVKAKENLNTAGPEVAEAELEGLSPLEQANKITRNFVLWSAGGGLIPMPLADIAAIYAAQVTMIAKLSKVYDIPFSEHKFKNTLLPLFGSLGVVPLGTGLTCFLRQDYSRGWAACRWTEHAGYGRCYNLCDRKNLHQSF